MSFFFPERNLKRIAKASITLKEKSVDVTVLARRLGEANVALNSYHYECLNYKDSGLNKQTRYIILKNSVKTQV